MDEERLTIVSADCHAGAARMADYRPYVEASRLADFDDYVARVEAYEVERAVDPRAYGGAKARPGEDGLWDIDAREAYLDADGISAEVIYGQGSVPFGPYPAVAGAVRKLDYVASPALSAAGCHIYNRWLADFCSKDPNRHLGVAKISIDDIDAAVAEVEWAARAGLKGGVHLPALVGDHILMYNDPAYEPLWAACAANEMVINLHGGANMIYGEGAERTALVLTEVDWLSRRALWFLIFSGVFERYPTLHLALTEQRTHWVAPMLRELDSVSDWKGNRALRAERMPRLPSEYFKSNCFVGASFFSRLECEAREETGVDKIMWGSDYPHQEGTWPWSGESLRWTFGCGVSSDELRAMLGGNAARCYRLDLADLQPTAERIGPRESDLRKPITAEELPLGQEVVSWAFRQAGAWH